jgi:hypothetical protein
MGLVRSHVFIATRTAPGTAVVPSGKRWLVKYVLINNTTGSSQSWSIQHQPAGSTNRQLFQGTVANNATVLLPMPFTMEAGDTLTVSGASASLVVHASGIEFTP